MPRPIPQGSVVVSKGKHSTHATLQEIQLVWAAVSAEPLISLRCLAERTGIRKTKIHHIVHFLVRAGYLQHKPRHTGRRVRIPMIWT